MKALIAMLLGSLAALPMFQGGAPGELSGSTCPHEDERYYNADGKTVQVYHCRGGRWQHLYTGTLGDQRG